MEDEFTGADAAGVEAPAPSTPPPTKREVRVTSSQKKSLAEAAIQSIEECASKLQDPKSWKEFKGWLKAWPAVEQYLEQNW